jgi:hypothetical protein
VLDYVFGNIIIILIIIISTFVTYSDARKLDRMRWTFVALCHIILSAMTMSVTNMSLRTSYLKLCILHGKRHGTDALFFILFVQAKSTLRLCGTLQLPEFLLVI